MWINEHREMKEKVVVVLLYYLFLRSVIMKVIGCFHADAHQLYTTIYYFTVQSFQLLSNLTLLSGVPGKWYVGNPCSVLQNQTSNPPATLSLMTPGPPATCDLLFQ